MFGDAQTCTGPGVFCRDHGEVAAYQQESNGRSASGGASAYHPGLSGREGDTASSAGVAHLDKHCNQVAAALLRAWIRRSARPATTGKATAVWLRVSQPSASFIGAIAATGSVALGRAECGGNASVHAVWRALRREGIYLQRLRTWCVSTDPEFAPKAAEVVGLYLNPPLNALVLSIDEKPSIQALQRPFGYVETDSGSVVRAMKSTYKRNGTLNLFAALEIASGQVHAQTTEQKKREDFRRFLDQVVAELPTDKDIHVILDNYSTHKKNAEWLAKYDGRVQFHFTPTSASWLNQIEIWFSLLTRKTLRGASFASKDELRAAIEAFVARTNQHPKPFHWRKREIKGSQLRNTIVNLCN